MLASAAPIPALQRAPAPAKGLARFISSMSLPRKSPCKADYAPVSWPSRSNLGAWRGRSGIADFEQFAAAGRRISGFRRRCSRRRIANTAASLASGLHRGVAMLGPNPGLTQDPPACGNRETPSFRSMAGAGDMIRASSAIERGPRNDPHRPARPHRERARGPAKASSPNHAAFLNSRLGTGRRPACRIRRAARVVALRSSRPGPSS